MYQKQRILMQLGSDLYAWFEDWKVPPGHEPTTQPGTFQPMYGLKLVIKEDLPQEQLPRFFAVERLAEKGLLAVDTSNSKREIINFKATIEVPMLGSIIEIVHHRGFFLLQRLNSSR